jgi:hypothetical protein
MTLHQINTRMEFRVEKGAFVSPFIFTYSLKGKRG